MKSVRPERVDDARRDVVVAVLAIGTAQDHTPVSFDGHEWTVRAVDAQQRRQAWVALPRVDPSNSGFGTSVVHAFRERVGFYNGLAGTGRRGDDPFHRNGFPKEARTGELPLLVRQRRADLQATAVNVVRGLRPDTFVNGSVGATRRRLPLMPITSQGHAKQPGAEQ